ncbi:hypothetical protein ACFY1C_26435 [Streptomyces sp. NPDC001279]|uniref:hypothetical protein n=1 Tax=Streptomyces sp. NPDC001279 TaxID=3364556 RepID=UPI0036904F9C
MPLPSAGVGEPSRPFAGPSGVVDHRSVVLGNLHADGAVDTHGLEGLIALADLHAGTVSADETGDVVVGGTPARGP